MDTWSWQSREADATGTFVAKKCAYKVVGQQTIWVWGCLEHLDCWRDESVRKPIGCLQAARHSV